MQTLRAQRRMLRAFGIYSDQTKKFLSVSHRMECVLRGCYQSSRRPRGAHTRHLVPINGPFDDSYFRNVHSMTFDLVINKDIPKYESSNGTRTAQLLSIKLAATRCGGAHLVPINMPFDDSYFRNAHSMTQPRHARSLLSHGTPRP